jgi:hypothetical protein
MLCILVGLLGCATAGIQLLAIKSSRSQAIPELNGNFNAFVENTTNDVNGTVSKSFFFFINDTNTALANAENNVNAQLFLPITDFVTETTELLNRIINETSNFLMETLNLKIFGPLVPDMFQCVVVSKVKRLLSAVNFLKILQLRFPRVSPEKLRIILEKFSLSFYDITEKVLGSNGILEQIFSKWESRAWKQLYLGVFTCLYGLSALAIGKIVL